MKNILVTGANGFIGKALVRRLSDCGYKVFEFDINIGDISEKDSLKIVEKKNIDHVFHLAARSFVPDSWKNPVEFYKTNVIGTANVLDFCRSHFCSVTYVSSYAYGTPDYFPIDENHPVKSYNPYSHSKNMAEEICEFYKKNFGVKITIFRPFNIYGPGQNEIFLIPEIIKQLVSSGKKIIEVNDLKPKRDYLYIDDFIDALMLSIDNTDGIYNIGSGYSLSVEEIIKKAIKVSGIDKKYLSKNSSRKNEVNDVVADISKVKKELGWVVNTAFEKGLKCCIDYYIYKI